MVITFRKDKGNGSDAMTITNGEDIDVIFDHPFQAIFNKRDNWTSAGSGWVIESVDGDYIIHYCL